MTDRPDPADAEKTAGYRSFTDDPRELRPASANRRAAAAVGLALLVVVIALMLFA